MADAWSERLSEYLDRDLSAEDNAALQAHLATCPSCQRDLADLKAVVAWLRSDNEDEAVATQFDPIRRAIGAGAPRRRYSVLIPWAAAAALAVIAGSLVLTRREAPVVAGISEAPPGERVVLPVRSRATASYHEAVADLEQLLRAGRGRIDPETQRKLESSLELIETAIRQSEAALAADTTNDFVMRHLDKLRRAKVARLKEAVGVVRGKS